MTRYLMLLMAAGLVATSLAAWQYRRMFKASDFALTTQNEAIKAHNAMAEKKLRELTAERDAVQAKLNQRAKSQEETDEKVTKAIASDSARDTAPVRVQYVTRAARCRGGSTAGQAAAHAQAGPGPADVPTGVLAPAAAQLTRRDRDAVEALQAAFNSCKSTWEK